MQRLDGGRSAHRFDGALQQAVVEGADDFGLRASEVAKRATAQVDDDSAVLVEALRLEPEVGQHLGDALEDLLA